MIDFNLTNQTFGTMFRGDYILLLTDFFNPVPKSEKFHIISSGKSNLAHAALLPLFYHGKHLTALLFFVYLVFAANVRKFLSVDKMLVAGGIQKSPLSPPKAK